MKFWPSARHCARKHIRRFELATKTDRGPEFRVPPIQHLRSLYSCPLASLTYTTPHTLIQYLRSLYSCPLASLTYTTPHSKSVKKLKKYQTKVVT